MRWICCSIKGEQASIGRAIADEVCGTEYEAQGTALITRTNKNEEVFMDLGIRGKKAIVVGGSAGMGKSAAMALAREGVELTIMARGEERLVAAALEIATETGANVTRVVGDLNTPAGREAVLKACAAPDILIISGGVPRILTGYEEVTEKDWLESFNTELISSVELIKATVSGMADRGYGRVVNIASLAAKTPVEARLLSGPMRSALINYSGVVARKLASKNVTINNILPGWFHTAGTRGLFDSKATANGTSYEVEALKWAQTLGIPSAKIGNPEDVGAFCALLSSKYASYVVGQSIAMDGGLLRTVF
jgi:3-oxoacyl-[acyl-carrier protein] reductase